jgi:L-alanine-DL-glutamate epimerase-like enolase superfamily enzyme
MRSDPDDVAEDARTAVAAGFEVVYIKVGLDAERDLQVVKAVRAAVGAEMRVRIDANEAWTVPEARRMLGALAPYDVDFVEAPSTHGTCPQCARSGA